MGPGFPHALTSVPLRPSEGLILPHGITLPGALLTVPAVWLDPWPWFSTVGWHARQVLSILLCGWSGGNAQESLKEEGHLAKSVWKGPFSASLVCVLSGRPGFSPTAAPRGSTYQLFRSWCSLGAALKNKLPVVGVLKRSVSSSSTYFFFPGFIGGGKEVDISGDRNGFCL